MTDQIGVASPKRVREGIKHYSKNPQPITQGDMGALVGVFNKILEYSPNHTTETVDQKRYLVWGFCFSNDESMFRPMRSKNLDPAHFYALKKWCGFWKDDEGKWQRRAGFDTEVKQVLTIAETFHFIIASDKSNNLTMGEMMQALDSSVHKIIKGNMIQSALNDLGGMATGEIEDTPEYEEAFSKPIRPEYKPTAVTIAPAPIDGDVPL